MVYHGPGVFLFAGCHMILSSGVTNKLHSCDQILKRRLQEIGLLGQGIDSHTLPGLRAAQHVFMYSLSHWQTILSSWKVRACSLFLSNSVFMCNCVATAHGVVSFTV